MIQHIDGYTDELLTIYGTTADDDPLAGEIAELASHARSLDIPDHFTDLFVWVQAIHNEVGCGGEESGCGCFRSTAA